MFWQSRPRLFRAGLFLLILAAGAISTKSRGAAAAAEGGDDSADVQLRGTLDNARLKFEREKRGHVAFMGGSITEMNGYRPMVCEILQRRFPQTEFTFTNAGIASTCSTTGAFRLATDVLDKGPVDLFFVEFAVNDDQDARHTREECIRGLEGIVRHARKHNPNMEIVIVYFVNESILEQSQKGQTPLTIAAHAQVAQQYAASTINLANSVAQQISAGTLTWKQFGGTHPAPFGNAICAKLIDTLFDQAWRETLPAGATLKPHDMPEPLDALNYSQGRFVDWKDVTIKQGWQLLVPDWKSLKGNCRDRFRALTMLSADGPPAELTLSFQGTAVGAYVLAGPDAGILEARIDDGAATEHDLYHRFSSGLHYPRTLMLGTDLKPGRHVLTLRISEKTSSQGHAARVIAFVAN